MHDQGDSDAEAQDGADEDGQDHIADAMHDQGEKEAGARDGAGQGLVRRTPRQTATSTTTYTTSAKAFDEDTQ